MKCRFIKICDLYKKALKEDNLAGIDACNNNACEDYYGCGRHAGKYRELIEEEYSKDKNGKGGKNK